jgi:hypothetical protein
MKEKEIRLFSYKMTHDTGFAPNPFGGLLSLATCKPKIRKHKLVGDWIAGFTSNSLNKEKVGDEKLIYLMKVTGKITFQEFWSSKKFASKKPNINADKIMDKIGDNIYKPKNKNPKKITDYTQIKNVNHKEKHMKKDLSGEYVLLSDCFYYFGVNAVDLPKKIRPDVPKGQSAHGTQTKNIQRCRELILFIQKKYKKGIYGNPTKWQTNDITWKKDENYIKS